MYKPSGIGPIELWTEELRANGALFGTGASDDWATTALFNGSPARPTHVKDQTSYATGPSEDTWSERLHGPVSPAKVKAGHAGDKHEGQNS